MIRQTDNGELNKLSDITINYIFRLYRIEKSAFLFTSQNKVSIPCWKFVQLIP